MSNQQQNGQLGNKPPGEESCGLHCCVTSAVHVTELEGFECNNPSGVRKAVRTQAMDEDEAAMLHFFSCCPRLTHKIQGFAS